MTEVTKKVILIAKDDPDHGEFIREKLEASSANEFFAIELATNTQEALQVIAEQNPVLVVSGYVGIDWQRLAEVAGSEKMLIWTSMTEVIAAERQGIEVVPNEYEMSLQQIMEYFVNRASRKRD